MNKLKVLNFILGAALLLFIAYTIQASWAQQDHTCQGGHNCVDGEDAILGEIGGDEFSALSLSQSLY